MRNIFMADCESLLIPEQAGLVRHEPFYVHLKQMEFLAFTEGDEHHKNVVFDLCGADCFIQLFRWASHYEPVYTQIFTPTRLRL